MLRVLLLRVLSLLAAAQLARWLASCDGTACATLVIMNIVVEEWTPDHLHWHTLVQVIADEHQTEWAFNPFFEPFSRTFVVALHEGNVVGFLMFVVWAIGQHDRDHPLITLNGEVLMEAKIIAFGVRAAYRRHGIGRTLQAYTVHRAKELGCYQVRSVSDHNHPENHQLKLSMGFGVEPIERNTPALAFIMPLRSATVPATLPDLELDRLT